MWETIFDLADGLLEGIFALHDKPDGCFGCLFKAISITIGIVCAILLFSLGVAWLVELF